MIGDVMADYGCSISLREKTLQKLKVCKQNSKKSHLSKYFLSYFKNITKGNTYYTIYNLVKL